MQFSKYFWMVLVVALVAATPLQAGVVLEDDFSGASLDTSKWSTMLGGSATIVQEDGVVKLRKGASSVERPFLMTVGEWEPAVGAEITVSGRFLSNGTSHCDIWTRAANYFDTNIPPWNGVADSGLRFGMSPASLALEGFAKYPGVAGWTEFGTKAYLPSGGSNKTWDFVLTDDGLNVSFTITEVDGEGNLTDNTATFASTSTLSEAGKFHVLFHGHSIDLDEVTISVGGSGVRIPGDANNNGIVNAEDASILAAHWQMAGNWGDGDFNNDQIVDDKDAAILAAHWLMTGEEYASVPEPAMLVLLAGGLVTLLLWRRK